MQTGHSGASAQVGLLPPHSDKSTIEGCLFCNPHPDFIPVLSDLVPNEYDLTLFKDEDLGLAFSKVGKIFKLIIIIEKMYLLNFIFKTNFI